MFNIKINCLTVLLLSAVYLLNGGSDDESEEHKNELLLKIQTYDKSQFNGLTNCLLEMYPFFGKNKSPITCVKKAITNLKLFGKYSTIYPENVKMYYLQLYLYVNYDKIPTPHEFCTDKRGNFSYGCYDELKNFKKDHEFDDSLTSSSAAEPTEYDGLISNDDLYQGDPFNYNEEEIDESFFPENISELLPSSSSGQFPEEGSNPQYSEQELLNKQRLRILLNALYYYKTVGSIIGLDNEQLLTHLYSPSLGQRYLAEINRHIGLKEVSGKKLLNSLDYCKSLYKNQEPMCNPTTFFGQYIRKIKDKH